ncbi:hypothetical protein RND71_024743 [Anisodus tanguticus]|uniref:Uncharacterized protein n=1 Tax=Anisodus tanguticus TaxID=243964 RepID=A0AAE1RRR8_9SOLA|nr:hypothetical protein RND71_024743 [Anisodus tanguticus]
MPESNCCFAPLLLELKKEDFPSLNKRRAPSAHTVTPELSKCSPLSHCLSHRVGCGVERLVRLGRLEPKRVIQSIQRFSTSHAGVIGAPQSVDLHQQQQPDRTQGAQRCTRPAPKWTVPNSGGDDCGNESKVPQKQSDYRSTIKSREDSDYALALALGMDSSLIEGMGQKRIALSSRKMLLSPRHPADLNDATGTTGIESRIKGFSRLSFLIVKRVASSTKTFTEEASLSRGVSFLSCQSGQSSGLWVSRCGRPNTEVEDAICHREGSCYVPFLQGCFSRAQGGIANIEAQFVIALSIKETTFKALPV